MFRNLIRKLLQYRHFWRGANFDEVGEIYVSVMFRSLALSLIGIFVPIFLIKNAYGLNGVAVFYTLYFAGRVLWDIAAGYTVARLGPKHTMLISYFLQIGGMAAFMTLPQLNWPLVLPAVLWGGSVSLFHVAFHIDFSKVKHKLHGGKELGYVHIMERIGGTIGPFVGGILATLIGAQFIFLAAILILLVGLVPLFRTAEPVKTHQHLHFKTLPIPKIKRDMFSYTALLVENNLSVVLWPVFLTLFVFEQNTYATIGILASVGILVSITAAYYVGKLVDENRGGLVLRLSAIGNAFLYSLRPFVKGIPSGLALNVANEFLAIGHKLPFMKALYDAADKLPGHRIVYIVTLESFASLVKAIVWLHLYFLTSVLPPRQVLIAGFIVASVASLLIISERFPALAYTKKQA